MKKFLVLYRAPREAFEQMMKASPAEQKAGMAAWNKWMNENQSTIADMGAPLGKSVRVTPKSVEPVFTDLGGYSILLAESKEALAAKFKEHPQFMMPNGFIDIVELMPMPGA